MDRLRWVLLGIGAVILLGIYLWGRYRFRRRRVQREPHLGSTEFDPLLVDGGSEPALQLDDLPPEVLADEAPKLVREEPVLEPAPEEAAPVVREPPAPRERLFVLYLVAPRGQPYEGAAVIAALRAAGLEFGDMRIFHRLAGGRAVFSAANLVEPGTLVPDELARQRTPGLTFFMRLPGPVPPLAAFDDFADTARRIAADLGGDLRDDNRALVDEAAWERMRAGAAEAGPERADCVHP